uniref:Endothelial differentiation-related factor 1 n=1 Tax=Canis lupus familiaris TaxID=9615 RepID=A0A8P0PP51_CANLF
MRKPRHRGHTGVESRAGDEPGHLTPASPTKYCQEQDKRGMRTWPSQPRAPNQTPQKYSHHSPHAQGPSLGMDGVTLEVGKVIQQGRQSKGLTQKDLAMKINEKLQVIADYESGWAIPNNQVLGKIERAIGLKLRGKDIGKPIEKGPRAK